MELLIVCAFLILFGMAVAELYVNTVSFNTKLDDSITAQEEAQAVLKTMAGEIRSASSSSQGAAILAEVNPNFFMFYSNIDQDDFKEQIRYWLDGDILKKDILKPKIQDQLVVYDPSDTETFEIIHHIANGEQPIFSYYDKNYEGTADPLGNPVNIELVRLVQITAIIDENIDDSITPIIATTKATIRNLKDNL